MLGAAGAGAPYSLIDGRGGGASIALHTELFPYLSSSEAAFSGLVDSLVQENFPGSKPPDPRSAVLSRKSMKSIY